MPSPKRTALVTGASRGIGRETATRLSQLGYSLALIADEENKLNTVAAEISARGNRAVSFCLDVTQADDVLAVITTAEAELGPIDVLVNCAGVAFFGGFAQSSREEWQRTLDVNVTGYFNLIHAVLPRMISQHSGTIINMSSVWGCQGSPTMAAYVTSKHAVEGLTKSLTLEARPLGIKVSSLILDKVDTDFRDRMKDHVKFSDEQRSKMLAASDVADAVEYLISASDRCLPESITLRAWLI